ncbi:hypothetical protein M0R45_005675 [Rubus argutus]|uniref:Ubiquitin-like protease family profile domain-containing protein n=1 Tax=Rubus argutus TaxID=59490 RepID=A0AAW1YNN3_RUBAR
MGLLTTNSGGTGAVKVLQPACAIGEAPDVNDGHTMRDGRVFQKASMEEDSTSEKRSNFSDGAYTYISERVSNDTCGKRRRLMHEGLVMVDIGCDHGVVVQENTDVIRAFGCNDRADQVMGLTLRTTSRLKEFRKTVSALSIQKLVVINELGFGPLHHIGDCNFNREVCQMLVENFDVQSCTLKIHRRDLCISEWDFCRLMGVRNGGTEVLLHGSIEEPSMKQLMSRICNHKNEITTDGLKEIIEQGMEGDGTFKVAFALYALGMILCPTAPGRVDPKFLIPLREPGSIFVPMSLKPIVGWTRKRSEMLIKWIISQGGFSSTCIFVMKRNLATSGGTKKEVRELEADIDMLSSNTVGYELNLGSMGNIFREIASSLHEMKDGSINSIVEDVLNCLTGLAATTQYMDGFKETWMKEDPLGYEIRGENRIFLEMRNSSLDSPVKSKCQPQQEKCKEPVQAKVGHMEDPRGGDQTYEDNVGPKYDPKSKIQPLFKAALRKFSRRESQILKFIFTYAGEATSDNSMEDVARCGDSCVTAVEIQSLQPKMNLSAKVINIAAAYMFDKDSTSWFFPTNFGESARSINGNSHTGVSIPLVILRSGLQRFHRLLKRCEKIFIPLRDEVAGQWFLLVVKLGERIGEIWDSSYDANANTFRIEIARTTMVLLQNVFANEMTSWKDVYYDFRRFQLTYPTAFPTNENHHDSGIYVVRHMQYYNSNWFEGVNVEDQRCRIALEIVMNPRNEALDIVKKAALGQKSQSTTGLETSKYKNQDTNRTEADTEFVHVNTDEQIHAPNGRKCRSHRKRRSRA